jgi:hypothetical protein
VINPTKNESKEPIMLEGEKIERVANFIYLGSVINENCDDMVDIERRIDLANAGIRRLGKVLWNKGIPKRLKYKIIICFIYPIFSYGCEHWALRKKEKSHIDAWWMKIMRRIAGVTIYEKNRSKDILKKLGAEKLSTKLEFRSLSYLGHIIRYPGERWVNFSMGSRITDQDNTGRQLTWAKYNNQLLNKHNLDIERKEIQNSTEWVGLIAHRILRGEAKDPIKKGKKKMMEKQNN